MFFLSVLLFLTTALAVYIWRFYESTKRYPKGPRPYPFVGNLFTMNFLKIHEEIAKFSKEYGNIFTIYLPKPHVVITDFDGVNEAFVKKGDDFIGRSGIFPDTIFQNIENGGVIFSQGENWREQRRAALHILRDFGMGKNLMEEQVLVSAQDFLAHLASIKNKDEVFLRTPLQVFIGNIINETLFGFRYDYDNCSRMMNAADELNVLTEATNNGRPYLQLRRTIKEDVARALESYSVDQEPECLVQAYYQKMQSNPNLNYENLLNVCMDFYLAGMETTTTTLRWASLLFASYPDVQEKIREEILRVVGPEGKPTSSHRPKMPYTNAAIQELQRRANILPLNVVHRTVRDTSVKGVEIPADTHVLGEIHQIMAHSPVFKDGHEFRPERFLMEDGITPNKEAVDLLCPFSMGKRQCAGEALARVELFVGVVTLLQNYRMFFLSVLLFLTTALAIYIWRFYENTKRYPKGPRPYPFVGNLLTLDFFKIHEEFAKLTKEYGSIFTIYMPKPHVVITDFDGVNEAFVKKGEFSIDCDDFIGRSGIFPDTLFQNVENGGVIFSQGENWREQRRASLHILRDFGMGKNLMEEQVLLSAQDFLAHLASIKNKDEICLREPIQVFIANIINKTLYGFSYEYDNCGRLMKAADELNVLIESMKSNPLIFVGQLFPIIHRLPVIGHMSKGRYVDMTAGLRRTIREDVTRALESYTPDQEPECLVQAYYQKMQSNSHLNYENLLNVCMDFYTAGMETTTTTLRWASLFFATHPEVQEKIREEILRIVGPEGKPTSSDRSKMPYTNAAIQELQRRANILPMNVVHRTVRDTSVKGVKIPADTHVLGEIHQIMAHSPVFKDGHEFRPERFLMEDGITPNKEAVDHLCPFSMGKRQCAGEALARVELFVGVVTLLQNYRIEPAKGRKVDLEPIFAGILLPKRQPLRLIPIVQ
ncbi:hypothetical protein GCK32_001910 [Trichostrongylus colubriformis]|uniref:Unspecific monooxygenase n=1 Tax=Trichostrongylus colubriformis TaxID=6319 RepID=A0AAN8GEG0_TRICO